MRRSGRRITLRRTGSSFDAWPSTNLSASEEGHIGANPARKLQIIKCQDNRGARILTRQEVERMIGSTANRCDNLILRTLFFSGARVSELTGLRWQDVQQNEMTGGHWLYSGKALKIAQSALHRTFTTR